MKIKYLYKVVTLLSAQLASMVPPVHALISDPPSTTSGSKSSGVEFNEVGSQIMLNQAVPVDPNMRGESGVATVGGHDQAHPEFSSYLKGAESIPVPPGRTVTIATQSRIARVYVANPSVVESYTANPHQLLLTAKEPGISTVIVWDEIGISQSYLIQSDIDVTALQKTVHEVVPDATVKMAARGAHLDLSGAVGKSTDLETVLRLAAIYSKDVANGLVVNSAQVKQVKLQVRMVEVDRSKLEQFGFNFFNAGGKILAQTSTNQFPSSLTANSGSGSSSTSGIASSVGDKTVSVTNALNVLLYSSQLNVGAMIRDMESKQVLQILAEPNITALSGQKANFLAGGEFPFPVVQGTTGGLTSITVQFRPYGVRLDFTPTVNPDNTIQLDVAPEVSALDYTNAVTISGYTIPALSTRRAQTQMVLKSGQSFAISGLLDKRTTDAFGRMPGIASIPILGQLFRSKQLNSSTTELLVIVTPLLVDPLSEGAAPTNDPVTAEPWMKNGKFDETLPKIKDR